MHFFSNLNVSKRFWGVKKIHGSLTERLNSTCLVAMITAVGLKITMTKKFETIKIFQSFLWTSITYKHCFSNVFTKMLKKF